jgi:hypothetical protein
VVVSKWLCVCVCARAQGEGLQSSHSSWRAEQGAGACADWRDGWGQQRSTARLHSQGTVPRTVRRHGAAVAAAALDADALQPLGQAVGARAAARGAALGGRRQPLLVSTRAGQASGRKPAEVQGGPYARQSPASCGARRQHSGRSAPPCKSLHLEPPKAAPQLPRGAPQCWSCPPARCPAAGCSGRRRRPRGWSPCGPQTAGGGGQEGGELFGRGCMLGNLGAHDAMHGVKASAPSSAIAGTEPEERGAGPSP